MGTLMRANRVFATEAVAGVDQVFAGLWLPKGTIVQNVRGFVDLEPTTSQTATDVIMAAIEGYILNVADPDQTGTMNNVWDAQVPKDTDANVMDLDAEALDTTTFWEPGKVMWEHLLDIGAQPSRIFHRKFMASLGINALVSNQDPETPFAYQFIGGGRIPIVVRRQYRVMQPSLMVFAVASPLTTKSSSTEAIAAAQERDWGQLQYIDHVVERAMMSLLGLTEAGAETPWDEATDLLRRHMNPPIFETNAATFVPVTWGAHGMLEMDVVVEGSMGKIVVDVAR